MAKDATVLVRLSDIEKEKWKAAAAQMGMTLSEYVRFIVNMQVQSTSKQ